MKAIILYDSKSSGGSTDALINNIGSRLADEGFYVEKAKCRANADYSFVSEFDVVLLGAPVYNFVVASQLLGALIQSNLKTCLRRKKVALFVMCGSPAPVAELLYMPQLKVQLFGNKIIAEQIFAPGALEAGALERFVDDIVEEANRKPKSKALNAKWSLEAEELFQSVPPFLQTKFKTLAEEYAEEMGYEEITLEVLDEARQNMEA
uniref:Protochlorophyllide oxidoreductase n=1 Tax=Chlorobium chlorochromatii (strain CaD3) TaxID=340177 RepID=Q3AUC8_CHLCH